ncbi:hypothetical protein U1Q18_029402 [Sarracenia purpurea var. burkii]
MLIKLAILRGELDEVCLRGVGVCLMCLMRVLVEVSLLSCFLLVCAGCILVWLPLAVLLGYHASVGLRGWCFSCVAPRCCLAWSGVVPVAAHGDA